MQSHSLRRTVPLALAKAVGFVPAEAALLHGSLYEPKGDGYPALLARQALSGSRGIRTQTSVNVFPSRFLDGFGPRKDPSPTYIGSDALSRKHLDRMLSE